MKRTVLLVFFTASGLAPGPQIANVRAFDSATTLPTMYHTGDEEGAMFVVVPNTSKQSPKDSESSKGHFSIGDRLIFSAPRYGSADLNRKGATPIATYYAEATVIQGDTFANMLTTLHFDFVFANGDHLTGQGIINWTGAEQRDSITGGTGAYEGARGTVYHSLGIDKVVIKH